MFPLPHGKVLAESIPGARLIELDGVGHQLPPPDMWDLVVDALFAHTSEA
jgi:pimeloyl-ACP methyl ester carboxylesterase